MNEYNGKLAFSYSLGLLSGVAFMGAVASKTLRDWAKLDEVQRKRDKARFDYVVRTLGPYAPREALEKCLNYVEFDAIVAHEEGK